MLFAATASFFAAGFAYQQYAARPPPTRHDSRPSALPADIPDFTGRHEETIRLRMLLRSSAAPGGPRAVVVSALSGKGGVGKTRLAVHVAHLVMRDYPDGQLYVNLRGAEGDAIDANVVLRGFLSDLGVSDSAIPESTEDRARLYRTTLAGRKVLVVLDNARDEPQVRPLLPGSPTCAVLVTSRTRLVGLDGTALMTLDVLSSDEAVELLGRIAGVQRTAAEPEEARQIVRLCGYLPLAVRVAGAQLAVRPNQTLRGLAARLADEKSRLGHLQVGDVEVRSSLAIGYRQRPGDERRLFRLLGGLRFADIPAWAVAALVDVDLATAERMADTLVDAGLLDSVGEDSAGQFRYRMHDLLLLIAREMTEQEDAASLRQAAVTSVLAGYLAAAQLAVAMLDGSGAKGQPPDAEPTAGMRRLGVFQAIMVDAAAWLRAELENLTLAVEQACDAEQWMIAYELAITLTDYYDTYSLWEQWEKSHTRALIAARRTGERAVEADLLWRLGRRYRYGRPDQALSALRACIGLYRELGNQMGEACALLEMGVVYREQGLLAEARRAYSECLPIFTERGDRRRQAYTLRRLAFVETDQAAILDAITHFQQCLALLHGFDDVRWTARTLRGLSIACRLMQRYPEAEDAASQALAAFRATGDDRGAGYAMLDLGDLRAEQGRLREASELLLEAITLFRAVSDERGEAYAALDLASVQGWQGQYDDAVASAARARSLSLAVHDRRGASWADLCTADLLREQGELAAAAEIYEKCLTAFTKLGDHVGMAHILLRRGIVQVRLGEAEAGRSSWREAAELYGKAHMPDSDQLNEWLAHQPAEPRMRGGIGRLRFPRSELG
jgi:tetratricopeptide (TPR) repeat protein